MASRKRRRHSGRKTIFVDLDGEDYYQETFWDDWNDYRDGFRSPLDRSKIRPRREYVVGCSACEEFKLEVLQDNCKHRKHLAIRKARNNVGVV